MTCVIQTHGVVGAAPGNVNCQPWSSQSFEKSLHIKTEAQIANLKKNVEEAETAAAAKSLSRVRLCATP